MSSKNYETGRAFEYRVRNHFIDLGYDFVRSSGSHTVIDLIFFKGMPDNKLDVLLVQCKTNGRLPPDERQALIELKKKHHFMVRALHAFKSKGGHVEFEEL